MDQFGNTASIKESGHHVKQEKSPEHPKTLFKSINKLYNSKDAKSSNSKNLDLPLDIVRQVNQNKLPNIQQQEMDSLKLMSGVPVDPRRTHSQRYKQSPRALYTSSQYYAGIINPQHTQSHLVAPRIRGSLFALDQSAY